jgi:hypothetical protein
MAEIDPETLRLIQNHRGAPPITALSVARIAPTHAGLVDMLRRSRSSIGAAFRGFAIEVGDDRALEMVATMFLDRQDAHGPA